MALQRDFSFVIFFLLVLSLNEIRPNKALALKPASLQKELKLKINFNPRLMLIPFQTTCPRTPDQVVCVLWPREDLMLQMGTSELPRNPDQMLFDSL